MAAAKHSLRSKMRQLRGLIARDVAAVAADRAAAHLLSRPELDGVDMVGLYAPMRGELSTAPLIDAFAERGVVVAFPRCVPGQLRLAFHRVGEMSELSRGGFGILEPYPSAPAVPVEHIGAFVIPGLAFDMGGWRLGWGKGHYDRTLADCPHALRIGYCFAAQLLESIPAADHDVSMHLIATETSVTVVTPWTPSV